MWKKNILFHKNVPDGMASHSLLNKTKEERIRRPRPRKDKVDVTWARMFQSSSLHDPCSFFQKVLCEPGFSLFSLSLFMAAKVAIVFSRQYSFSMDFIES